MTALPGLPLAMSRQRPHSEDRVQGSADERVVQHGASLVRAARFAQRSDELGQNAQIAKRGDSREITGGNGLDLGSRERDHCGSQSRFSTLFLALFSALVAALTVESLTP